MTLQRGNISDNVWKLYEEVKNNSNLNSLEIFMEKPYFSNGNATYTSDGKGNFKLYITPEYYNDFVFSHELLHLYIKVKGILPSLTSWDEKEATDTIRYLSILLTDLIDHKWIINEQRRRGILGEKQFVEKAYNNIINLKYQETGNPSEDFLMIEYMYTIMNDYPEYFDTYKKIISEKFPSSLKCVNELLEERLEEEIISPYYARRYIVKKINKFIELFSKDNGNYSFIREEITVKPVFRESQLDVGASALLGVAGSYNDYYFLYTLSDNIKCSPYFKSPIRSIKEFKSFLSKITLRQLLDKISLPYYIDDRKSNWH